MVDSISVNGQHYSSWEEVPDDVKQVLSRLNLPDADGNGVPDMMEGRLDPGASGKRSFVSTSLSINGRPVVSSAEVPDALRSVIGSTLGLGGTPQTGAAPPPSPATAAAGPEPGVPAPGQMILNGETVAADGTPRKRGFLARLLGR